MNLNRITTVTEANKAIEGFKGDSLHLNSLTSAKWLVIPPSVRWLYLNSLTSTEKAKLKKKYPNISIS